MKHLVYCVLRGPGSSPVDWPAGVDGEAVSLLVEERLAAAFTPIADDGRPSLPRLLSYAGAIDALHQRFTVLPMRYGSVLDELELRELLRKRRATFEAALDDLAGCVEMGIRFLADPATPASAPRVEPLPAGGVAYLAARQVHYAERDRHRGRDAAVGKELRQAFHGLFRQIQTEPCTTRGQTMLLFSFLVRRTDVGRFRDAFQHIQRTSPARMLLTGPWPPYHFAHSQNPRPASSGAK